MMKRIFYYLSLIIMAGLLYQCTPEEETTMSIIPKPVELDQTGAGFTISQGTKVSISDESISEVRDYFIARTEKLFGIKPEAGGSDSKIKLTLDESLIELLGAEGYKLLVNEKGILIEGAGEAGIFYGIQSLLQLTDNEGRVTGVSVTDYPRFAWRGFMLDVSRHFLPKEYILKTIDNLAMHKMNSLHLHLVDDQGWRIEIKKYPKLTEIGAWRVDREDLHWNARESQKEGEKATYGGFYTQDDIREIVAYAKSRQVRVVPEIEMPGHTTSALAAYPEYACTDGPFTVLPGGIWPITDIYCAGKDETFSFLEDVLDEVMDLFPSEYIHIGGDEANKKEWEVCDDCQRRIKQEGLDNEHELQSYFITRIEKYLNSKGRQLIGWDEILEGGLAPNAAVMSWRGMQGGIEAAKAGHPVVMSPTSHCYFDYYQGQPDLEPPAFGGFLPLQKVYSFEPVPDELTSEEKKFIRGVQANLWTEYVPGPDHADYMTYPRLSALSELAWTPKELKDFNDFASRLRTHLPKLDKVGINYSKSFANVDLSTEFDIANREFLVQLSNPLNYGEIRYTLDGSDPDEKSAKYTRAFTVNETTVVKAITIVDQKPYSGIAIEKVWIHNATGASVSYNSQYSEKYTAGGKDALTNSLRGSVNHGDGRWQGYEGKDLHVVIDLGKVKTINKISLGCFQNAGSWIFHPEVVSAFISNDGKTFKAAGTAANKISPKDPDRSVQDFVIDVAGLEARYVKVIALSIGTCPEWHSGAGSPAWLFADEIIIE